MDIGSTESMMKNLTLTGKSAVELEVPLKKTTEKTSKQEASSSIDIYYLQITQFSGISTSSPADGPLAVLCSTQNVRMFDPERLVRTDTITDGVNQITAVRFSHTTRNLVYTASVDSVVRCWDLRQKSSSPVKIFTVSSGKSPAYLSCDISCDDQVVCASTKLKKEDAFVHFWDCRGSETIKCYEDLHSDDITLVRFHSSKKDLLITAGDDGLVNSLDISQSSEEEALLQTLDTQSTPDKVNWVGDDKAFVSTFCNSAYLWDVNTGDEQLKYSRSDFQACVGEEGADNLVDCFTDPASPQGLYVIASSDSGDGEVLKMGTSLSRVGSLTSGHRSLIRACVYNHVSESLYTIGEDAMLCCWKPREITSRSRDDSVTKSSKKSKHKKKPYDRER